MSGHDHAADRDRLAVVLAITATVMLVEVVGALVSGSLALLADAGHMLTDVAGLLIGLLGAVLPAVGVFVLVEAVRRLSDPPEVASTAMAVFGVVGLAGNLVSMLVLPGRRGSSLTTRAAFLEVVADALGSVAVLVAAVVIALTGWLRADPVVSLLIGGLILPRTFRLLRETTELLLEATPPGLDLDDVRGHLLALPHVHAVHDLHASRIASDLPVLTAHVVIDDSCFQDGHAPQVLDELQDCVARHFPVAVEHSTFQLEPRSHADHEPSSHA